MSAARRNGAIDSTGHDERNRLILADMFSILPSYDFIASVSVLDASKPTISTSTAGLLRLDLAGSREGSSWQRSAGTEQRCRFVIRTSANAAERILSTRRRAALVLKYHVTKEWLRALPRRGVSFVLLRGARSRLLTSTHSQALSESQ